MKFRFKNPIPRQKEIEKYDPRIHGIRQSMLSSWQTCRELARLTIVQGWRDKGASLPLIYGSLSHGVIKIVTRGIRAGNINEVNNTHSGISILVSEAEKELLKEYGTPTTDQKELIELSCAILEKKLPHYFSHWWEDDYVNSTWSMVEDKFMVPITMDDGEVVPLIGTFDATFYNKKKGNSLWLFETKNKSRWSDDIGTYLPLDLQVGIYTTALSVLYQRSPVGIRYNILRRPGERRKVNESLTEFSNRIESNIISKPDHYFQRLDIEFTPQEKEEHISRTEALCQAFYDWWKETELHRDKRDLLWNSGSCEHKYGTCRMLEACANKNFSAYKREGPNKAEGHESYE